jgi:hypothetical protein
VDARVARWFVFKPKSQFGKIMVGLAVENLDIFYVHLIYFTAIGNILWPFGIFYGYLVYFPPPPCWYVVLRKIWQPWWLLALACMQNMKLSVQICGAYTCINDRIYIYI